VRLMHDRLGQPLRWRKPRRVFVDSMSDLFHESVPDEFIDRVFAVMMLGNLRGHTFQVLTKRPGRMHEYTNDPETPHRVACEVPTFGVPSIRPAYVPEHLRPKWPLHNVWLGTSVESEQYRHRIDRLRGTDARVKFLSLEPLLGPLPDLDLGGIDWVIVGGESGPGARPCDVEWIRAIVEQCRDAKVPVFVKQLGARPVNGSMPLRLRSRKGNDPAEWPEDLRRREMP